MPSFFILLPPIPDGDVPRLQGEVPPVRRFDE